MYLQLVLGLFLIIQRANGAFEFSTIFGNKMVLQRKLPTTGYARVQGPRRSTDTSGVVTLTHENGTAYTFNIVTELSPDNDPIWYADIEHDGDVTAKYTIATPDETLTDVMFGMVIYNQGQSNQAYQLASTYSAQTLRTQMDSSWDDRVRILDNIESDSNGETYYMSNNNLFVWRLGWMTASDIWAQDWESSDSPCAINIYMAYHMSLLMEQEEGKIVPVGAICMSRSGQPEHQFIVGETTSCNGYGGETIRARMYDTYVLPFSYMTVSAITYYQGENAIFNGREGNPSDLTSLYPCMLVQIINQQRALWAANSNTPADVPWVVIQIPLVGSAAVEKTNKMPRMRMGMSVGETLTNSYTIPTFDVGEPRSYSTTDDCGCGGSFTCDDPIDGPWCSGSTTYTKGDLALHPRTKRPIGYRLAYLLFGHYYKSNGGYIAPKIQYCKYDYQNSRIELEFDTGDDIFDDIKTPDADTVDLQICTASEEICKCPLWESNSLITPGNPATGWTCIDGSVSGQSTKPWTTVSNAVLSTSGNKVYIDMPASTQRLETIYGISWAQEPNPCCDIANDSTFYSSKACPVRNCRLYTKESRFSPHPFTVYFNPTSLSSSKMGICSIETTYHKYLSPKTWRMPNALQAMLVAAEPNSNINKFYTSNNRCQGKSFALATGDKQTYGKLVCENSGIILTTPYSNTGDLSSCAQACYDYNQANSSSTTPCNSFNKVYASSNPQTSDPFGCELLTCEIRDHETKVAAVENIPGDLLDFGWLDSQLTPECNQLDPTLSEKYALEYGKGCDGESAISTTSVHSPTECSELCTADNSCNHFVITPSLNCELYANCATSNTDTANQFKYSSFSSTDFPTSSPTQSPTSLAPTQAPVPKVPTKSPTLSPTLKPTLAPTTKSPTKSPVPPTTAAPTSEEESSVGVALAGTFFGLASALSIGAIVAVRTGYIESLTSKSPKKESSKKDNKKKRKKKRKKRKRGDI